MLLNLILTVSLLGLEVDFQYLVNIGHICGNWKKMGGEDMTGCLEVVAFEWGAVLEMVDNNLLGLDEIF